MNARYGLLLSLLLITTVSHAELGRLFYTPAQRAGLEMARQQNRTQSGSTDSASSRSISYDGIVIRNDGKSTRWINGRPRPGQSLDYETGGKTLKPGQTLYHGRVYEAHDIRREEKRETP